MDQTKIGAFIAQCRKEKGLTQAQLAEKLNVTDRAVSKWERAKYMPDSSIMLELCEILDITVNELLSGERIVTDKYEDYAEKNMNHILKSIESAINKNKFYKAVIVILLIGIVFSLFYDFGVKIGGFIRFISE